MASFGLRGTVATMDGSFTVHDRATVYVADGAITRVVAGDGPAPPGFEDAPLIDTDGTVYPGLIELHNHLAYNVLPPWQVTEQYANRAKWQGIELYRKNVSGPMNVLGRLKRFVPGVVRYVEAKCLLGGVTTSQGVMLFSAAGIRSFFRGVVRNVEQSGDPETLPHAATHVADVEASDAQKFLKALRRASCMLLHLSEGVDPDARKHFDALRIGQDEWALHPTLAGIHCVALTPQDFDTLAAHEVSMVWSPLSNLLLYGQTAQAAEAKRRGVRIGLGSDWSPSGSKSLLWELKIARVAAGGQIADRDLVAAVTRDAAGILRWQDALGTIEQDKLADLIVVDGRGGDVYERLLDATEKDLKLVVVNGTPRYGLANWMQRLGSPTETVTVGGSSRALDLAEPASHPAVAAMRLGDAQAMLADAFARLPALAVEMETQPIASFVEDPNAVFLVLDHDEPTGQASRPHLPGPDGLPTAELPPMPFEAAEPLSELLVPMRLDPVTVADDAGYFAGLRAACNLPQPFKDALPS